MNDRTVSLGTVWASVAWVTAFLLMAAGTVAAYAADSYAPAFALLSHALLLAAVAAVLTVRNCLDSHVARIENAYRLGQDVGGANVRPGRFKP